MRQSASVKSFCVFDTLHPSFSVLGFFKFFRISQSPRREALKTLIIECLEELSPNSVFKVCLLTVARAVICGTGSSAPCTPTLGAGWALGPARNTLRVLCPSTEGVCGEGGGGAARRHKLPSPTGQFQLPAALPQLLIILKTKVCGFSEPSAVGYRNLKDGVLSVSSLMALTVF